MRRMDRRMGALLTLILCLQMPGQAEAAIDTLERTTRQLSQALQTYRSRFQQEGRYDAVFQRDPMQAMLNSQGRVTVSAGLGEGLAVQGIIWSEARPLVVIDDHLFAQGDVVGPYKILEIHPNRVVAQLGDESKVIQLDRDLQKQETPP